MLHDSLVSLAFIPTPMFEEPDAVLVCADGKELPCHLHILSLASPALAGFSETSRREDGKVAVPFRLASGIFVASSIAELLLRWLYKTDRRRLSVPEAKELARVAHFWGITGLQRHCAAILRRYAYCPRGNDSEQVERVVEVTALAAEIEDLELLSECEDKLISLADQVVHSPRLSQLSSASLYRIMAGWYATCQAGRHGVYCWCGSSDVRLYGPGSHAWFVGMKCRTCGHDDNEIGRPVEDLRAAYFRGKFALPTRETVRAWVEQMETNPYQPLEGLFVNIPPQ